MRTVILLFSIFIIAGCRTRQVVKEQEKLEVQAHQSTISETIDYDWVNEIKELVESSRVTDFNSALSLVPAVDSAGNAQPISYVEKRNGQPYREIQITGGSLQENKQESNLEQYKLLKQETETYQFTRQQIDSLVDVKLSAAISTTETKTSGLQFGAYLVGGILLLFVLLIGCLEYRLKALKKLLNQV